MYSHLLGWSASHGVGPVDVTPIPDEIITINNAHFVPQKDMYLNWAAAMNSAMDRVQVVTPTLRQITSPFLTPLILALISGNSRNVADYRKRPLLLKRLEEVQVLATLSAAGPTRSTILASISPANIPLAPNGSIFTLRGASTTAAVANAWSLVTVTWQDVLPVGRYVVVGMRHISANGQAARLIFEEGYWRPGVLSSNADTDQVHEMFLKGELGTFGEFDANRMPNVQVLANGADAAHEIYLDIIKIM